MRSHVLCEDELVSWQSQIDAVQAQRSSTRSALNKRQSEAFHTRLNRAKSRYELATRVWKRRCLQSYFSRFTKHVSTPLYVMMLEEPLCYTESASANHRVQYSVPPPHLQGNTLASVVTAIEQWWADGCCKNACECLSAARSHARHLQFLLPS